MDKPSRLEAYLRWRREERLENRRKRARVYPHSTPKLQEIDRAWANPDFASGQVFRIVQRPEYSESLLHNFSCTCCCLCCRCYEHENEYDIYVNDASEPRLVVKEHSKLVDRVCCAPHHQLNLRMVDVSTKQDLFAIHRPYRMNCIACCPLCLSRGFIAFPRENKAFPYGHIRQNYCCTDTFHPSFSVVTKEGAEAYTIQGSSPCVGGIARIFNEERFKVLDDKWREVGVLTKARPSAIQEWIKEVATDADSFVLRLEDSDVDTEALLSLFATVILLDYLVYENGGLCERTTHGCMSCQLCNVYICGYVGLWRCYF